MKLKIILSIIIEQLLILCILLIHLSGFMNVSQVTILNGNSSLEKYETLIEETNHYHIYKKDPLGKKTVLLIIDALRADHLVSSKTQLMKYSTELLVKKQGIGYLIKTASPTVTLPRIKSIVTGAIPNFMDVIFNFASKEIFLHENIVSSAHKKSLKINFYGDETWLKLYPQTFNHFDPVTSFFVSDYTEVDNNVTRHLPNLLSSGDYDFLILHYLGLDHIGHLEGPKSSLMPPKLKEMDNIIKLIHENLKNKGEPYLFLVCGDHGMSDLGGHGGDSHSEIWTSAMLTSNLLDNSPSSSNSLPQRIRSQVDLASTLALYLGVDIPSKNVGFPLFELLENLPLERQLVAHYRVAKQLMRLALSRQDRSSLGQAYVVYDRALKLHREASSSGSTSLNDAKKAISHYKQFELLISSFLTEKFESYDLARLLASSVILIMMCFPTVVWTLFLSTDISSPIYEKKMLLATVLGCFILLVLDNVGLSFISATSYIIIVLFIYGTCNLFSFAKCFTAKFQFTVSSWNVINLLIVVAVIVYPFSLLATSFVEEEHFAYYFIISMVYFTLLLTMVFKASRHKLSLTDEHICSENKESLSLSNILKLDYPMSLPSLYNADHVLHSYLTEKRGNGLTLDSDRRFVSKFIIVLICWCLFRLLRSFNATGDKWKNLIHLNDFLRESEGPELLVCVLIGLGIAFFLYRSFSPIFVFLVIIGILGRHFPIVNSGFKSGLLESQFVYLCLFILIIYNVYKIIYFNKIYIKKHVYNSPVLDLDLVLYMLQIFEVFFALLFLLLQKPENILVSSLSLLHFHLILSLLVQNCDKFGLLRIQVYIFALWLGQASFFLHGNSNSFSTVQVHSGFVGISSYHPVLHGVLIAYHTFGSKFLVLLHTLILVLTQEKNIVRIYECIRCWWMLQLLTLTVYVINVTLQRYHLFIWSVFAPKLLYEESHFLCLMILTVLVYSCLKISDFVSCKH